MSVLNLDIVCNENLRNNYLNLINYTDFDECSDASTNNCNEFATCTNSDFGFSCECNNGYYGNGTACYGKLYFILTTN